MASIAERIKQKRKESGHFIVVAAERMLGKTTIAGTLPGKTLFLFANVYESGYQSAVALAKRNGNKMDALTFTDLKDLVEILSDDLSTYDNIFIDGISAVSAMKADEPLVEKLAKTNVWDAYKVIGDSMRDFIFLCKEISTTGKNVITTLALTPEVNANGNLTGLKPVTKGKVVLQEISGRVPIFVTLRLVDTENGGTRREMVTKSDSVFPGRIDAVLDEDNPGVMEADLGALLKFVNKETK
jgi:hypothetical protein